MSTYVNVFGGDVLQTSEDTYLNLLLSADTSLVWPLENAPSTTIVADLIDVTPSSGGFTVTMPDATQGGLGVASVLNNLSSTVSFTLSNAVGGTICTLAPGTAWLIYLTDNSTSAGVWATLQYGAQAGSINLAAIAGSGIKVISSSINQSMPVQSLGTNYVATNSDRATVLLWAGAAGSITLPAAATVGTDWFVHIRNSGSGDISVAPPSGTIDGAASKTFSYTGSSAIVFTDGSNYYTIGYGSGSIAGGFDYTTINVGGTGDYTITGAQLNRISYKLTGVLTGNRNFIVPASVQQYWINNATSGAFTLTVKPAAGTGVTITQGSQAIVYCDGTNVVTGVSGTSFPLSIGNGGTGASTAPTALTNLGGTAVGVAVFAAASAAAARATLGSTAIGDSLFTAASASAARTALVAAGLPDANVFTALNTFGVTSGASVVINSTNSNGAYATFQRSGTAIGDIGNSGQFAGTLDNLAIVARAGRALDLGSNGATQWQVTTAGVLQSTKAFLTTGIATAASFTVTGSAIPVNGLYLPAANTVGVASNSLLRWACNSVTGHFFYASSAGNASVTIAAVSGTHSFKIQDANTTTYNGGFLELPINVRNQNYTATIGDSGQCLSHTDGSAYTWTIPANASVAYPVGTTLSFDNDASAAVNITIAITSDTLTLSPGGTTGSRTLAQYGRATAHKLSATRWKISGTALT